MMIKWPSPYYPALNVQRSTFNVQRSTPGRWRWVLTALVLLHLAVAAQAAPLKIEGIHDLTSTETQLRVCVEVSGTEDGQWYQFERREMPGPWEDFYHPWPGFSAFPIMTYCMDDEVRPYAMYRLKKTATPLAPFAPLLTPLGIPAG